MLALSCLLLFLVDTSCGYGAVLGGGLALYGLMSRFTSCVSVSLLSSVAFGSFLWPAIHQILIVLAQFYGGW